MQIGLGVFIQEFFLPLALMFILYRHNSRNLTLQLTVSSELPKYFHQTTRCHIPSNLPKPRCSFLSSYLNSSSGR